MRGVREDSMQGRGDIRGLVSTRMRSKMRMKMWVLLDLVCISSELLRGEYRDRNEQQRRTAW